MLALQLFTAAVAFRFDRESLRPLWRLPLQQFAYRQLMYLVLMQSATTALTGGRLRWHKLHRAGLTPRPELPAPPCRRPRRTRRAGGRAGRGHLAADARPGPRRRGTRRPAAPVPAAGAGPAAPTDPEDLPSAGSPPAGGSGPVYTG